jgi:hypothetical protein
MRDNNIDFRSLRITRLLLGSQWVPGPLSAAIKVPRRAADRSPSSCAEVSNEREELYLQGEHKEFAAGKAIVS